MNKKQSEKLFKILRMLYLLVGFVLISVMAGLGVISWWVLLGNNIIFSLFAGLSTSSAVTIILITYFLQVYNLRLQLNEMEKK